ncbi:unnamed protein product, partial [Mesorhabditis spiculigera]
MSTASSMRRRPQRTDRSHTPPLRVPSPPRDIAGVELDFDFLAVHAATLRIRPCGKGTRVFIGPSRGFAAAWSWTEEGGWSGIASAPLEQVADLFAKAAKWTLWLEDTFTLIMVGPRSGIFNQQLYGPMSAMRLAPQGKKERLKGRKMAHEIADIMGLENPSKYIVDILSSEYQVLVDFAEPKLYICICDDCL